VKVLFPISLICLLLLASCADKTICPAFQSYFVLDEDKRNDMFSYFAEDSLPKEDEGIVSKNMFGIIEPPNYFTVANITAPKNELRARNARMSTIEMEVIYPFDEEDSLDLEGIIPDSSQASNQYQSDVNFDLPDYSNLFDSVATQQDSAQQAKPEYHYNIDQIYYMELIGDEIMEGRQARLDSIRIQQEEAAAKGPDEVQPKVKQPFFKRLFSKKKKKDQVELTDEGSESPALPAEETEEETEPAEKPKKKKGFNLFKKKKKDKQEEQTEDPGN
jgi:hypothetical protein